MELSGKRFRALFEQSAIPMQVYAADGRCLEANDAWEKLFATKRSELEGYNVLKDPQVEATGVLACIKRALAGETVHVPPNRYDPAQSGKKGRARWLEAIFSPIKDDNGVVCEFAILFNDITDIKEIEQVNARLFEEAQEAIKARDVFLSIASHELRTPLTAMKMQVQMLSRRIEANDPDQKVAAQLDRSLGRLNRLVDDMLDISRIAVGKMALRREEMELETLVREVVENFAEQLREASMPIRLDLAPGVKGVWDRDRLEQVLANLISNAIRYAPGAPLEITVRRDERSALLVLTDQGPGIAKKDQKRIFERFERLGSAEFVSGFGLGLFISREIVEAHAGGITLESAPGEGARFIVELPL